MKTTQRLRGIVGVLLSLAAVIVPPTQAAIIGADGGITFYISYDNLDVVGGASWNDMITQVNSMIGASCSPTNNARALFGAPSSPGSCPGGDTCLGHEKLTGDIQHLAEYIFEATEGRHYLRRVYLADNGRAWANADIRWNVGSGGSSAPGNGWKTPGSALSLNSSARRCIHDVAHHEIGHYFYHLPDKYASAGGYYSGTISGGASFDVAVDEGDVESVMSSNFPHRYSDPSNSTTTLTYTPPGDPLVAGEVLTPALLTDADPNNDGPDRAHHGYTHPFAQDDWARLPTLHPDLTGAHTEGSFPAPNLNLMPPVDIRFLGENEPFTGTILLLDRSGSMGVLTNGVPAVQFVQEAGMYLYHSALDGDWVGTQRYNAAVDVLFDYAVYDPTNQLPFASYVNAAGLTNIAAALQSAIDTLIAEHGEDGTSGARIVLMSDGKQTTGPSLWDQVDRAVDQGIQIHTLSFGDADSATMEAIATATDGEVIEMSEVSDASELKHGMARKMSEMRGLTPVHFQKGLLTVTGTEARMQYHEGSFAVPPGNRALQFYLFLRQGNAATLDVELQAPDGTVYLANPQNVAIKGRLNGLTVKTPMRGTWTFRIKGTQKTKGLIPTNDPMEIIANVSNPMLDARVDVVPAGAAYPGQYRIVGSFFHRYPVGYAQATADIYIGLHKVASVNLLDDGQPGVDDQALDGTYAALFNPARYDLSDKRPKARVEVRFTTTAQSQPAPGAVYEVGANLAELAADYSATAKYIFTAFATANVTFRDKSAHHPRIVSTDPATAIRVQPGDTGTLVVVVDNSYLSRANLTPSLGAGIATRVVSLVPERTGFRSTLVLAYEVSKDAAPGLRDLLMRDNKVLLSQAGMLEVMK
jgi:hypothetical protein